MSQTINDKAFKEKHRLSDTDFTRNRLLNFPTLILYLLNLRKHSNQVELDQFLKTINENNDNSQHITKSAFIQARKQLSHTAFTELNRQLNGSIYINPQLYKTWKGFRLCAIDGTSIRLPDETEITEHFGVQKGRLGKADCTIAMASTFYDVLNHIVIDSSINHKGTSEKHCAAEHLKYARYNDLVIYDRGYCAFWFYAHHIKHNQSFCMRAKANQSLAIKAFVESDKKEALVTFEPNKPLAGTALNACSWMVG
ncbi:MAG: IS4 family transposase [Pseudomonadota bacterium]